MLQKSKQRKRNAILIGSLAALGLIAVLGILTVLIPNTFFLRMTPINFYDYIFLLLTGILGGISVGLWYYAKTMSTRCATSATGGVVGGVFSFGCAICNKLLVALLGVSGVLAYFAPIQPYLGVMSIGLLSWGVYGQIKGMSDKAERFICGKKGDRTEEN